MEKFCKILISCFLIINAIHGQGINFESGLSWDEVRAKAKLENKYIFVDFFATWCGPCKFMSNAIFTKKEVGDYFNIHFINVAVQMDQTKNDPSEIIAWYKDAKLFEEKYSIEAYPTYLFFSPDGNAVHRIVGVVVDAQTFIGNASVAFDPNKQYYNSITAYKTHLGDSAFLRNALITAISTKDNENALLIGDAYFDCLKDPCSKDNLEVSTRIYIKSSHNKWFLIYLKNLAKVNSVMSKRKGTNNFFTQTLSIILAKENLDHLFEKTNDNKIDINRIINDLEKQYPILGDELVNRVQQIFKLDIISTDTDPILKRDDIVMDWNPTLKRLEKKYPGYDVNRIIEEQKCKYYAIKKMWPNYDSAVIVYLKDYGRQLDNEELNNIAWYKVFLISDNQQVLSVALDWSKITIADYPNVNPAYVDTYANLLYKSGQIDSALSWEKKALEIVKEPTDKKSFEVALEKMKRGEKTWVQN